MEERPLLVKANTTKVIAVSNSSAATVLPTGGGRNVCLCNRGSLDVFFNFGDSSITVAIPSGGTAGGAVVPPGAVLTFTSPEGATHIATIASAAGPTTLYVTCGDGS